MTEISLLHRLENLRAKLEDVQQATAQATHHLNVLERELHFEQIPPPA